MITLIVISYDGYSDCWNPFFTLLRKYFPESEKFEIILSTTTKKYEFPGLKIKTLAHGKDAPWGKRLRLSIKEAKYDIVFPLTEDYFLKSKVDFKMFNYFVNLISDNKQIDHIRLLRYRVYWKAKKSKFDHLEIIEPVTKHRFLFVPGIWKKQTLYKYLKDYENPFMSEKISGFRSWIRKDGFYSVTEDFVKDSGQLYDTFNSGFVFKGKWVPWGLDFLRDENIKIDYSKRGILIKEKMKKTRIQSKLEMLKNPISTSKSVLSLLGLLFESIFINMKGK